MEEQPTKGLKFDQNKSASPQDRKNHLFVIGINDYVHASKLNNARRDAESFRDILLSRYDFDESRLYELYDEQATRINILNTFDQLANSLTERDNLIVYFSGHGSLYRGLGYWIPVEGDNPLTSGISNHIINNSLEHTKALTISHCRGNFQNKTLLLS
jgi:sulfatase modifying factor 1